MDLTDSLAVVAEVNQPTKAKSGDGTDLDPQVKEMLWGMVQGEGAYRLDEGQQQKLYHLLLAFSDTFAFNSEQLGRTINLWHIIKTGGT